MVSDDRALILCAATISSSIIDVTGVPADARYLLGMSHPSSERQPLPMMGFDAVERGIRTHSFKQLKLVVMMAVGAIMVRSA